MILNDRGKIVRKCWLNIPDHFPNVKLDEFIIMPNHVHGIICIINHGDTGKFWEMKNVRAKKKSSVGMENVDMANVGAKNVSPLPSHNDNTFRSPSKTIGSIIRGFKIGITKWFRQNTDVYSLWQRNYWEHIIRDEQELNHIRKYIINNPS